MTEHRAQPRRPGRIVQVCPNDHPPFADLCTVYAQAAALLDVPLDTVFLGPPTRDPVPAAHYLNVADTARTRSILPALTQAMGEPEGIALALCHRYRAYWSVVRTGMKVPQVTIAHEYGLLRRRRRRWLRHILAPNVRFAGVSPSVAAELASVTGETLVLPNGLDLQALAGVRLAKAQARTDLGLSSERFSIGVIGRLHRKKRPVLALQATAAFAAGHSGPVELVYLGDGELREAVQAAARQDLPASLTVRLCGFVEDARRYLAAFDVVLIASSEEEAFGMVAIEAMAAGVPVVAAQAPGVMSALGEVGVYYQTDTAAGIAAALTGVADQNSGALAVAGVARAEEHFSVAATARRLQALLEDQ